MKTINRFNAVLFLLAGFFIFSGFLSFAQEAEKKDKPTKTEKLAKKRKEIQKMNGKALKKLYKLEPQAKGEIANSRGYAVFGTTGINLLLLSTANGSGLAHSNATGKETYMSMYSAGIGVGIGVKKYSAIFIFSTSESYENFVEKGWQASGQADAAAKSKDEGGAVGAAMNISPEVKLYQITNKGFAAQATVQGSKYWKNEKLNGN